MASKSVQRRYCAVCGVDCYRKKIWESYGRRPEVLCMGCGLEGHSLAAHTARDAWVTCRACNAFYKAVVMEYKNRQGPEIDEEERIAQEVYEASKKSKFNPDFQTYEEWRAEQKQRHHRPAL